MSSQHTPTPPPIKVVDATTAVAELRREFAMRQPTWPCVLLKDLMPLCDSHDELVAALRQIVIEATESPNSDANRLELILEQARAALAKAGAL